MLNRLRLLSISLSTALLVFACGGGSLPPPSTASANLDILLRDAAADDLSCFGAEIAELRLRRDDQSMTSNLLSGPTTLEFLGLEVDPAWIVKAELGAGSYDAVVLRFTPNSYEAKTTAGTPIPVDSTTDDWVVPMTPPLVLADGAYGRLDIDLDLVESLEGSVSNPPLVFDPSGSSSPLDDSSGGASLDEFKGLVTAISLSTSSFSVDAFVDDEMLVPLGSVDVSVGSTALLVDDDGAVFSGTPAFLGALIPGITVVEVHGLLGPDGQVLATVVEIEDHGGGFGDATLVKIEGRVMNLEFDTPNSGTFDLSIQEIEKGASIATPVIDGAPSILVSFSPATLFFHDDDDGGGLASSADLAVGMEVKVKFATFSSSPYPAHKVELENDGAQFEGYVSGTVGLPDTFEMNVKSSSPAILAGLVASSSTDVTVHMSGANVFLDTEGKPALDPGKIVGGIKVEVQGTLSGPPTQPEIDASKVKLRAGRLQGEVLAVSPATQSFTVFATEVKDAFGSGVGTGTVAVNIAPGAVIDAPGASLFDAFANLGPGEVLEVEIEGIGTGFPNEVEAFEIEGKIED